ADGAHGVLVEAAQALAEAREAGQRPFLGFLLDALVLGQTGAEAHRLAQRIERVDLVSDDAPDLAVKAVRTEIDSGKRGELGHGAYQGTRRRSRTWRDARRRRGSDAADGLSRRGDNGLTGFERVMASPRFWTPV